MNEIIKLSELVSTRLSHDLAGQIGAIYNSIELLEESPDMADQIIDVLAFSAKDLMGKIKFFRTAYGLTSETDEADLAQLREIAEQYLENKKIELHWDLKNHMSHYLGKIALILISIVGETLLHGGKITVSTKKQVSLEGIEVQKTMIDATGETVKFHPECGEAILGNMEVDAITSKTLPCYMIFLLAHKIGQNVDFKTDESSIHITVG